MNATLSIPEPSTANGGFDSNRATVASLCMESGWAFAERAGDCLVKLEVNREAAPFYARVERAADGGIKAWVDLAAATQEDVGDPAGGLEPPAWRAAVEAIFAEVSNRIRLVRGVFRDTSDSPITVSSSTGSNFVGSASRTALSGTPTTVRDELERFSVPPAPSPAESSDEEAKPPAGAPAALKISKLDVDPARLAPGHLSPAFEVDLSADSGGEHLAEALGALSVACQFAGPEIQLLMSEPAIVEIYLAQSGRAGGCSIGRPDNLDKDVPGESSF